MCYDMIRILGNINIYDTGTSHDSAEFTVSAILYLRNVSIFYTMI